MDDLQLIKYAILLYTFPRQDAYHLYPPFVEVTAEFPVPSDNANHCSTQPQGVQLLWTLQGLTSFSNRAFYPAPVRVRSAQW